MYKNKAVQKALHIVIGFAELAKLGSEQNEESNLRDNKILSFA
jgi:hypothetical protein